MRAVEDSSCFVERHLEPLHRFGAYLFYFYLRKRWRSLTVSIETASRPSVDDDGQRTINIWLQLKCCKLHFCGLETNPTAGVTFSLMLQFFWISLLQCDVSFSPKRGNECRRSTLNIFFFCKCTTAAEVDDRITNISAPYLTRSPVLFISLHRNS